MNLRQQDGRFPPKYVSAGSSPPRARSWVSPRAPRLRVMGLLCAIRGMGFTGSSRVDSRRPLR